MKTEILKVGAPVNLDNIEVTVPTNVTISAPERTLVRRIRVLEYVGTEKFVTRSIEQRQIKGSYVCPSGSIREALLGETNEILTEAEVAAIEAKREVSGA